RIGLARPSPQEYATGAQADSPEVAGVAPTARGRASIHARLGVPLRHARPGLVDVREAANARKDRRNTYLPPSEPTGRTDRGGVHLARRRGYRTGGSASCLTP